jgi:hypothetical protein
VAEQRLAEALATIPERRRAHLRVHDLVPLLQFAVAAMLCGARSLYAMAKWGRERLADQPELLVALGLRPGRSPCVATLHRVYKGLDVAVFERAVGGWLAQTGLAPQAVLAVDGKTLRGIHGEQLPGGHLVAVYAVQREAVLAQVLAPGKGQELAATKAALARAPRWRPQGDRGAVVLGDSLQTQREVCTQRPGGIRAAGGDYVFPVKENQPALRADLRRAFSPPVRW